MAGKIKAALSFASRHKNALAAVCVCACMLVFCPTSAFAASGMLATVMKKLSAAVQFIGGCLIVLGGVNVGLALKDGLGGGGQLSGAFCLLVSGALIVAVAKVFAS